MNKYKIFYLIFFILIFSFSIKNISAQSNISFRASSLIINPIDTINRTIYKNKITSDGLLTFEPGINFAIELYGNDITSAKISQSLRMDACSKLSGSTQLLLRFRLFKKWKNSLAFGIGPVLFFRQTWLDISDYQQETYYQNSNSMQNSVVWLSGELEYNYYISKHGDLSISINHTAPHSVGLLVGYKYWFSRKSNKCNTCPSYR